MTGASFHDASDVRGIVVVDEIELHLHARHQYEVLPNLIRLFPKVQFILTSHSPLFVLGMESLFGEDGFALHRLPGGLSDQFGGVQRVRQRRTAPSQRPVRSRTRYDASSHQRRSQ